MTDTARPEPRYFSIPVFGWIARDISRDINNVWYLLFTILTLLVLGVKAWGLAVLGLTGVVLTPVMLLIIIAITLG